MNKHAQHAWGCITTTSTSTVETESKGTLSQVVNPYLTIKWMYQRRVIVYMVSGPLVMQEVAETWFINVKRVLTTWSLDLPYLAIHDLSNANVTITPYVVSSIRDLYNLRPELTQRIGIVVPRTLTAQLLKVLVRNRDHDSVQTQFFNTREKAVNWMLDYSSTSPTT